MKTRLMMVSLTSCLVACQVGWAQADSLVDVNPIPELADLEKQAQVQEEKVKAFAENVAKKKAEQSSAEGETEKAEKTEPVAKAEPVKPEPKARRVETTVTKSEPQPETKTFTTTAGSTTIINNATGSQSVVVNVHPETAKVAPKKVARKQSKIKKREPEGPVDMWTAQERQYSYP